MAMPGATNGHDPACSRGYCSTCLLPKVYSTSVLEELKTEGQRAYGPVQSGGSCMIQGSRL